MKIPFMQIRGGSSKGIYFLKSDLPVDEKERNEIILKVMEGTLQGDSRQIDGLGGANSLTSKVAIVSISEKEDCDLDYFFIQVVVGKGRISTTQTCGNILAGVLPFAIESGLIKANNNTTSAKINIINTAGICECVVETPEGQVNYAGEVKIDGVVGTAAPIICNYLDTVGATCGSLLPTSNVIETIEGVETTCIDNGMPLVIMRAADFGLSGYEDKETLDANAELKDKIEKIRLEAGKKMNLGDVAKQTIPKMCLVSKALNGGTINTRMFIPHVIHEAIGVLAAVSVATACIIPGSICSKILNKEKNINESKSGNSNPFKTSGSPQTEHINELDSNNHSSLSIEHPSGEFTVNLEFEEGKNGIQIKKSGVVRTARIIAKGEAFY